MSMDPKIKIAIDESVKEAGQPDGLALKIVRWFEAVASGNENITDKQSAHRHLELLYEEIELPSDPGNQDQFFGEPVDEEGKG